MSPSAKSHRPPEAAPRDRPPAGPRRSFFRHLHPPKVTERALAFSTTLGLGVIALSLLAILLASGVLLMLYYVPTISDAYHSVQDIEQVVTFGQTTRLVHRFAGHAVVAIVLLHLFRVWAHAAYRARAVNWLVGLGLLGLVLGLAFTGYLLPWDQTSYWAVRVVSSLVDQLPLVAPLLKFLFFGGTNLSQATLVRFYALHVAILPAAMTLLVIWHLWRVRRDNGLVQPAGAAAPSIPAWPHLVGREAALLMGVVALVLLAALVLNAPLAPPADIWRPQNPEKAPWYFVGIQEMVSYSTLVGGLLFPAMTAVALVASPWLDRQTTGMGHWFGDSRERRYLLLALLSGTVVLLTGLAFWVCGATTNSTPPHALADLLNPAAAALGLTVLAFFWGRSRTGQLGTGLRAALMVLFVAWIAFTVLGLCRGPNWIFYWPWQEWPHGV